MTLETAGLACVLVFILCAFMLRARMRHLHAIYETRMRTLIAAELVLLNEGLQPDIDGVERELEEAAGNCAVMKRHETLFRLLWPHEFDCAFYSGQRVVAQASRVAALTKR